MYVTSPVKDVCYGGARGGGKSAGLLLAFATYEGQYGSAAKGIIFRKTYKELEYLVSKGKEFLVRGSGWKFKASPLYLFTSPRGAELELSHLERMEHAEAHDGHEHPWQGFDEIGNWATPEPIDHLIGCMRTDKNVPTYRRSTCMPGGPGHVWVKERYDPEHPYIPRLLAPLKERPDLTMESLFIPALLEDNPSLDKTEYELTLAGTGNKALFDAWRYGRWDVVAGAYFENWSEADIVVPPAAIRLEPWSVRWVSCDWGYKDDCVVHWHMQDEHNEIWTYRELKMNKTTPRDIGKAIVEASTKDDGSREKLRHFFLSPDAFAERDSPRTIAGEIGAEMLLAGLPQPSRADDDRVGGWQLMNQLMLTQTWKISKQCKELVRAIPLLQRDDKKPEDVADHPYDHAPDSARYGLKTFIRDAKVSRDEAARRFIAQRYPEAIGQPSGVTTGDTPLEIGADGKVLNRPAGDASQPGAPAEVLDYQRLYLLDQRANRAGRASRLRRRVGPYERRGRRGVV